VQKKLVVLGGSAGSLNTFISVLRDLDKNFPAAVIVILHMRARVHSSLDKILARSSALPVSSIEDGIATECGKVYVAVPDRHIVVGRDHLHLSRGPKEGLNRPSINVAFRSAAAVYGPEVVGVLLSGMLDDGAAGLLEIVKHGGVAMVQDPEDTKFPSMPTAALQNMPIHYCLRADEIATRLNRLAEGKESPKLLTGHLEESSLPEIFSGFTCPECHGPLFVNGANGKGFRCRVGHAFSLPSLLEESAVTQERRMYEALVALEEGAALAELSAKTLKTSSKTQLMEEAQQLRNQAAAVRKMLEERNVPTIE
jgi:two-component system, chemotaxis family, protein-glutamate methylesterase/glutaminase